MHSSTLLLVFIAAVTAIPNPTLIPRQDFTGITGPPGLATRYPIKTLHDEHPDVFNVFVLAMESLMKVPESDPKSWYQISGIHGRPYNGWEYPTPPNAMYGFCTHGTVTFGTWHRPYMSLLEQVLVEHANKVAAKFKGNKKKRYQDAAKKVRIPYWDSSEKDVGGSLPQIITEANISVEKPNGAVTIPNPLAGYKFQSAFTAQRISDFGNPEGQWAEDHTSRNFQDWLQSILPSRRKDTYELATHTSFSRFSTGAFNDPETNPSWRASLESIHDAAHGAVDGWMGWVDYAAFDPLFYFHHVNVDRQMALYQAMHPYDPSNPRSGIEVSTYQAPPSFMFPDNEGRFDGPDTKLYPFRKTNGQEFTSRDFNSVRSVFQYGYTYPEMPTSMVNASDEDLKNHVIPIWKDLYYDVDAPVDFAAASTSRVASDSAKTSTKVREWSVALKFDKAELASGFNILVYLKSQEQKPIGMATAFAGFKKGMTMVSEASVALNPAIVGEVDVDDVEAAKSYLAENLEFKTVAVSDGKPVTVKSLEVKVGAGIVEHSADPAKLPKVGEWEEFPEITEVVKARRA